MKTCIDQTCGTCGHSLTRHQKPNVIDPDEPTQVVCFECLYGPRRRQQQ